MPFVDWPQQAMGFTIKKRLGLPNEFGWIIPGWSEFGDDNIYSGVYQTRRCRKGTIVGVEIKQGRPKNFWQRPAWPVQPPSEARDQQQLNFFYALQSWQALTTEQKNDINEFAKRQGKRGFDLYMSRKIKSIIAELG